MSSVLDALKQGDSTELIKAIKADGPVKKTISWPNREDIQVVLKLLNASESRLSKIENQQELKAVGIEVAMHNLGDYRASEAAHGMWRAILDPTTLEPVFKNVDSLRAHLTDDEIAYFVTQYNAISVENDPNGDTLTDEQMEDVIELLKKKKYDIQSKVTSLPIAWKLLLTMAEKLQN